MMIARPTLTHPQVEPTLADRSDEELLLHYRENHDAASFEALVDRYEQPLYSYLLRYLRNAALAEDVFQATLLRIHQKCHQFTESRRVRPWLYSIATHQAIDALRKEGRQRAVSLNDDRMPGEANASTLWEMLQSHVPLPWQQIDEHERAAWTQREVDRLSPELREVILLIYFQGLKFREAAEVLGIPLGTIKSRVHNALVTLNAAWQRTHTSR